MKINQPEIQARGDQIVFTTRVEASTGGADLWYSLGSQFADLLTDACDAPLVSLLIPAMAVGEDIHIHGAVSERLFFFLSGPYQRILQHIHPGLQRIRLFPAELRTQAPRPAGVAAGFTGGIDSFSLLADHHYASHVPGGFRVTHLLFHNTGSHGREERSGNLFQERGQHIRGIADRIHLPLVIVDSNVASFFPRRLGYVHTITQRNAAIPLILQGGIGRCLIASSYSYPQVVIGGTRGMTFSDPVTLPMLSTEALELLSVGGQYTRVEKVLQVAEIPDTYDSLDVCFRQRQGGNCSTCPKCVRTLLTLEIAGLLERYAPSFDLEAYRRGRSRLLTKYLTHDELLFREVVAFARERHFSLPLLARSSARLKHWGANLKRLLKRMLHSETRKAQIRSL